MSEDNGYSEGGEEDDDDGGGSHGGDEEHMTMMMVSFRTLVEDDNESASLGVSEISHNMSKLRNALPGQLPGPVCNAVLVDPADVHEASIREY